MTRRNSTKHSILTPTAVAIVEAATNVSGAIPECKAAAGRTSAQRVDDLLRAFSDTAYSLEEEEHSWESWNYNRLSAF